MNHLAAGWKRHSPFPSGLWARRPVEGGSGPACIPFPRGAESSDIVSLVWDVYDRLLIACDPDTEFPCAVSWLVMSEDRGFSCEVFSQHEIPGFLMRGEKWHKNTHSGWHPEGGPGDRHPVLLPERRQGGGCAVCPLRGLVLRILFSRL